MWAPRAQRAMRHSADPGLVPSLDPAAVRRHENGSMNTHEPSLVLVAAATAIRMAERVSPPEAATACARPSARGHSLDGDRGLGHGRGRRHMPVPLAAAMACGKVPLLCLELGAGEVAGTIAAVEVIVHVLAVGAGVNVAVGRVRAVSATLQVSSSSVSLALHPVQNPSPCTLSFTLYQHLTVHSSLLLCGGPLTPPLRPLSPHPRHFATTTHHRPRPLTPSNPTPTLTYQRRRPRLFLYILLPLRHPPRRPESRQVPQPPTGRRQR